MFLTRFPVNMTRRKSRAMLASPYELHAAIAGSFSESVANNSEGRVLWRLDRSKNGAVNLLIASPEKPSLVGLDEQIGWPDIEHQWKTRNYDPLLNQLEVGQRYAFRLVANPVVSRSGIANEAGRSKRIAHLTVLQQAAWLAGEQAYTLLGKEVPAAFAAQEESRAMRNGFRIVADSGIGALQLVVSDSTKVTFAKSNGRRITLAMARYDGLLEVADEQKMRRALCFGIGHAKSFGCGLITLAPAG